MNCSYRVPNPLERQLQQPYSSHGFAWLSLHISPHHYLEEEFCQMKYMGFSQKLSFKQFFACGASISVLKRVGSHKEIDSKCFMLLV